MMILAKPHLELAPAHSSLQLLGQTIRDHGSCVLAPRAQASPQSLCYYLLVCNFIYYLLVCNLSPRWWQ